VGSINATLIEASRSLKREFEIVIVVDVVTGEMLGSD
jgi:hypothetical protein